LDLHRSTYHYCPRQRDDAPLATALRSSAAKRRRWGYRRLMLLLRREGWMDNHKRIYRIYTQQRLQVRCRRRRRPAASRGQRPMPAVDFNQRWSMDFVSDQLANGRRIRVLNVLDDFSRRCLAAEVDTSLPGLRVCRVLERTLVYQPGRCPPYPRSMASGLQHRTTTQLTAKSHPGAVCPAATANRFITSKTSLGEWSITGRKVRTADSFRRCPQEVPAIPLRLLCSQT